MDSFSVDIDVRFETAPELVCGVKLDAGEKIAWSIADYLTALEQSVGELLQKRTAEVKPEVKAKPEPEQSKSAARPQ